MNPEWLQPEWKQKYFNGGGFDHIQKSKQVEWNISFEKESDFRLLKWE